MKRLNRETFPSNSYPTKIIQFGEGNFLRAFIGWQIDLLNEHTSFNGGISVIRPIETSFPPSLNTQQGLYTTLIRGLDQEGNPISKARVISSINEEISAYSDFDAALELARNPDVEFIFSNTTEAGIAFKADDKKEDSPPSSFPAKLTLMLWARYLAVNAEPAKGLIIIPCELIDYNGDKLQSAINKYIELWDLPEEFKSWVNSCNTFCSTLVDRIVTGYPKEEIPALEAEFGYNDTFFVSAENFYLFVIQGPKWLQEKFCLNQLSDENKLNIKIVNDIKPYKDRKVAILNGAHTALVPIAYQIGIDTVGESMQDEKISTFLKEVMFKEIIPTLSLPKDELEIFAKDVENRFKNPYIRHLLLSISLNGMTKFKTRIIPQLLNYSETKSVPPRCLTFSLAALITFYRGQRNGERYSLIDDQVFLDFFAEEWANIDNNSSTIADLVYKLLSNSDHWGIDLTTVPELENMVSEFVTNIIENGMCKALANFSEEKI